MRELTSIRSGLVAMALALLVTHSASSQGLGGARAVLNLVVADSLYNEDQMERAYEAYVAFVEATPQHYEALWKAARTALILGLLVDGDGESENRWFMVAEGYALRATAIDSTDSNGLYWLVAAKGERAVQSDAVTAARLGTEVYALSHRLLAMDSFHAGAHHALGVLNYQVMKLSRIERFIATRVLGGVVLRRTSWELAERFLLRAIDLEPDVMRYHLDLGKMYLARQKLSEARETFEYVLSLPQTRSFELDFQRQARRQLARLP